MDSTLTFIVVFVFKPKRLAILNWSIFFCKKERAFLISGDFFLLLVEYVFLNLYFIFWHAFLKFKIKHSRVVIWELSICSLRWVPVLSIHSTILHTVRLATHPKYELYMCILQLELIFFGWFYARSRRVIWKSSSFWLPMVALILIELFWRQLRYKCFFVIFLNLKPIFKLCFGSL